MQWEFDVGFAHSRAVVEMARHATVCDPSRPGNWLILSRALVNIGDFEGAVDCLREAVVAAPRSGKLRTRLVDMLMAQDLWQEAFPHAEAALTLLPGDEKATIFLLDLLTLMQQHDQLDMDAVAALAGKNPHLMNVRARSLGPAATVDLCDSLLAEKPGLAFARYRKAVALVLLGRIDEACEIISVTRLIETVQLGAPPGFPDEEAFRGALAQEIRANPTLRGDLESKATRGGLQTRILRQPEAVAVEALMKQVKAAIDAYEARLVAFGDAFVRGRPKRARLNAWAVIYDGDGQQNPHIHPSGWITGVYYVSAARGRGENAYRGPLVLGADPPIGDCAVPPWGTRDVEPVPGRLVIFPSHLPHATVPPGGASGERICVAFDVVDAAEAA